METQTWELTDEQYNELLAKSEELHTLCKKLQVPAVVALQIANAPDSFGIEGYSSFDLPRICINMLVLASVFDILTGTKEIDSEEMGQLMQLIHQIHHKYYGAGGNVEVSNAE